MSIKSESNCAGNTVIEVMGYHHCYKFIKIATDIWHSFKSEIQLFGDNRGVRNEENTTFSVESKTNLDKGVRIFILVKHYFCIIYTLYYSWV